MAIDGVREILHATTFRRMDVDPLLDLGHPTWVSFDPELGYIPADIVMRDGMDFSNTTYTHEPGGQRRMVNYRDQPCRVNTYGDSFTQCQQVSDDETWQERLAAHLGEPIRNFGSGGYGVNQAWLRAMRVESTGLGAEYILLNIFDDDHIRNLDAARWIRTAWNERDRPADRAYPLHGLPWAHLRYDIQRGCWLELPGLCEDADALRALCDPDHFYEVFKDDFIVHLFALELGMDVDIRPLEDMASALGVNVNLRDPETRQKDADRLHRAYGFKSTEYLLEEKVFPWAKANNRKALLLLSYSIGSLGGYLSGAPRFDAVFVEYLNRMGYPYVDPMLSHAADHQAFRLDTRDYIMRYYIGAAGAAVFGHYTPAGNFFYAFAIKNALVDWLDPKPPAYRPL